MQWQIQHPSSSQSSATLQKSVSSKRCFAQKHIQPSMRLVEKHHAEFKLPHILSHTWMRLSKTNLFTIGRSFKVEYSLSRYIQHDGLAQTGVLSYPSHQDIRQLTLIMQICTSSTAQGGGGSFKNRKPIGELGCCE